MNNFWITRKSKLNDNHTREISDTPLVSIITPSYNQGKFIRQTIDSVLAQTYKNIEYIVIDGGSTDETIEILESYHGKVRYISEKDNGQGNAINKGLALASGDILGFLNSDDYLLPDAVQNIVDTFAGTSCLWVSGDYKIVDSQNRPIQKAVVFYKQLLRLFSSKGMFLLVDYIIQPSTYWRRELMQKVGKFDESLDYVMDYDYWLRAMEYSPVKIIRKPLSCFRIHGSSKGGVRYVDQFAEEILILRKYRVNKLIIFIHSIHNKLITTLYKVMK